MDNIQINQHISRQFNAELEEIRNKVLAMGGVVEQQIRDAVTSLIEGDIELAEKVIANDMRVNAAEVDIDEECSQIIARRQPAASDLRLVVAIIKTITDLERIGDQAERVAHNAIRLNSGEGSRNYYIELRHLGDQVSAMVHDVLDAFARMDPEAAVQVAKDDVKVDKEYESVMRQAITFMMEDPRAITGMLDIIWIARALERIGDHAKNIGEYVIYLVKGKDVRHIGLEKLVEQISRD